MTCIWESSNQLRISISITLGNHMSSIRKTSITSISGSVWETSIGKSGSSNDSPDRWVVDERSWGADHSGGASEDGWISISRPLAITNMGSVWETSIGHNRSSEDRPDWWVVDKRSRGSDHPGGASKDGWISISRPLAIVSKPVVSNSNRDSVSSDLSGNLSWGLLNTLDNWDMGDSVSSS